MVMNQPKKSLGQHFLTDLSAARSIVESMAIGPEDTVLEIGPGKGVLTEYLLESPAKKILAVEIDRKLGVFLKVRFDHDKRFQLIEENFLNFELQDIVPETEKIRIIGNLPYNITSPILFKLLDFKQGVRDITITIQKEVAERIVSGPGSKTYGIPSVLFQLYADTELLFHIPRDVFDPVPAVDSSVLQLTFFDQPAYPIKDEMFFRRLVKTAFGQRRKMLRNSLKNIIEEIDSQHHLSFNLTKRPEELSLEEFVSLSNQLKHA